MRLIKNQLFICNSKHNFAHSSAQDLLAEMNKFSKQSPIQMGIILNSDHYAASGIHAIPQLRIELYLASQMLML